MGLDMYLYRAPRYKGCTMDDVAAVEYVLDYRRYVKSDRYKEKKYGFSEWCGIEVPPAKDVIDFYAPYEIVSYSDWDTKHENPWYSIREEIGYWRKANHIHGWFVNHVQDWEDDCEFHREVTEEDLKDLMADCEKVLSSTRLVPGKVYAGETYENGRWTKKWIDGMVLENDKVARKVLPKTAGFFFGDGGYEEWYYKYLEETVEICRKALETTDFEKQMIYYRSSW